MKRYLLRVVQPHARRLLLYIAAAMLLVAAGKGMLINLPGYIREGATGSVVFGSLVWGAFIVLAVGCLVMADRKPRQK